MVRRNERLNRYRARAPTGQRVARYTAAAAAEWARRGYPGAREAYNYFTDSRTSGNTKYMLPGAAKYFDLDGSSQTLQLTKELTSLEGPGGGGVGYNQKWLEIPDDANANSRSGNHIWVTSIYFKFDIIMKWNAITAGQQFQHCSMYVYLVEDLQCNGTHAQADDVWDTKKIPYNIANLENSERFNILGKKKYSVQDMQGSVRSVTTDDKHTKLSTDCYFDLGKKGKEIIYKGSTGGIGERTKRNLILFLGCDNQFTNGSLDMFSVRFKSRVRFRG